MPTLKHINTDLVRLNILVSLDQKKLFQRAAALLDLSLPDFMIDALEEVANRTILEHEAIRLSERDQQLFIQAILNPPEPNAKLIMAIKRHHYSL